MKLRTVMLNLICVSILFFTSGCDQNVTANSRTKLLDQITDSEDEICEKMASDVFATLAQKDAVALKGLFSSEVIEGNTDLDDQIDVFLNRFNATYDQIEDIGANGSSGSKSKENGESHTITDTFTFTMKGETYHGSMVISVKGSLDVENADLVIFEIDTPEAYDSAFFQPYIPYFGESGLFYQDSPDLRDGLLMIEDGIYKDLDVDRTLTESQMQEVLNESKSHSNLVEHIGTPDATWEINNYSYYKLTDALYAVCHTKQDVIEFVYITDAESKVKTLWLNEDYVEIWGSYFEKNDIDRTLTQEDFLAFTDQNQSVEAFQDKYGEPSAEKPFYIYYELENGQYLMCHKSETFEEIYLVDDKSILTLLRDYNDENSNIEEKYWEKK